MDLTLVKQHLRIDGDEEDALIASYIAAARSHIEQHCDRRLVDGGEPTTDNEMALTPDIQQAVLLLVGHWHTNREAAVVGAVSNQVQLGVERLLWYRKRF